MAYPVVEGSATSTNADRSGTTLALKVPAGVVFGETLVAYVSSRNSSDTISLPSGWVQLFTQSSATNDDLEATVWVKKADGTESGTISVTVANVEAAGIMLRISNAADPTFSPPVVVYRETESPVIDSGGNDTTSSMNNHGLLSGPFGRYDRYLGIVSLHYSDTISSYGEKPDNYSNFVTADSGGGGAEVGVTVGHRDIQSIGEFFSRWSANYTAGQRRYGTGLVVYPRVSYSPPSTFPYINQAAFTSDAGRSSSTVFKAAIPPTEAGDVIVVVTCTHDAAADTVTWPTGWNELYDKTGGGGGTPMNSSCAWKKADGSEGRYITLTVDANPTCSIAFTVNNVPDPEPTLSDCFEWNAVSGFATVHGAGSITPAAGSGNYLWVGVYAVETDNGEYYGFPTDYDGRFVVKGDWSINSEDVMIVVAHSNDETARTALTSNYLAGGTNLGSVSAQFVFKPGSFDPGNWWYMGRYPSGRGGHM